VIIDKTSNGILKIFIFLGRLKNVKVVSQKEKFVTAPSGIFQPF
jgi:hypothetical protein